MNNIPVIGDLRLAEYFQMLSSDSLYPSAGSSAAMTSAHAAALFAMACRVNLRKIEEGLPEGKENNDRKTPWQEALQSAELLLEQSLALAQEDGFAIKGFMEGVPRSAEKIMDIPLKIAYCADEIVSLTIRVLAESYAPVQADIQCARLLAEGSRKAALAVACYNLPLLNKDKRESYIKQISKIEQSKVKSKPC